MRRKFVGFAALSAIFLTTIFLVTVSSTPAAANSRYGANYFPNTTLITQDGKADYSLRERWPQLRPSPGLPGLQTSG